MNPNACAWAAATGGVSGMLGWLPLAGFRLALAVSAAGLTAASASTILWSASPATSVSEVSNVGTAAWAYNFSGNGQPNPTVNGVTFTRTNTGGMTVAAANALTAGFERAGGPDSFVEDNNEFYLGPETGLNQILDGLTWGANTQFRLTGLAPGTSYLVQIFSSDDRAGFINRVLDLDSNWATPDGSRQLENVDYTAGGPWANPAGRSKVFTGTFLAAAPTQDILAVNDNGGGQIDLNAVQLRIIPGTCPISAAATSVARYVDGPTDTFSFIVTVTGGAPGGSWRSNVPARDGTLTGTYGVGKVFGPFASASSPRVIHFTDSIDHACIASVSVVVPPLGMTPVYEPVFRFADVRSVGANKGAHPYATLIEGTDGNYYGSTERGGSSSNGTIFRMTPAGTLTTLVDFTGNTGPNRGSKPVGALVQGSDGNFYGTTREGGSTELGTVFRMTPSGVLTTLLEFTGTTGGNRGTYPYAGLVEGADRNFYGATSAGGTSNRGTIFRMTPAGTLTAVVDLTSTSESPYSGLVQGSDLNFYGTAYSGGTNVLGTVFRWSPGSNSVTPLVNFTGNGLTNKGGSPHAGLVEDIQGNFYGTTQSGGASNFGTIFRISPGGNLITLVEFTGTGGNKKGRAPYSELVIGVDGNFYGTTERGGANDLGTVFKMTPSGELTTLTEFSGIGGPRKGQSPFAGLLLARNGDFYGSTGNGGTYNFGTIFRISPSGAFATLLEFTWSPGGSPAGGLVLGHDGNLFGTSHGDERPNPVTGEGGLGTVFKVTPSGVVTTLVHFTGNGPVNKGSHPYAGLTSGTDGNLYGTTYEGGTTNSGTVFRMTPSGALTTLVEFRDTVPPKGRLVFDGLVQGSDGNFYGVTNGGGATGQGTVFRMTPSGVLTTLVDFTGIAGPFRGRSPAAALVQASDGNLYGSTELIGSFSSTHGTLFRMTPAGSFTSLVDFTGTGGMNRGREPVADLVQGLDGFLYGTTLEGGANGLGTVFKLSTGGGLTTLADFSGSSGPAPGRAPWAGLFQAIDGYFYGTATNGGAADQGVVFRIGPNGGYTTIFDFAQDTLASLPQGTLTLGPDGNLYGTTQGDEGGVYRLVFPGAPAVYLLDHEPQADGSVSLWAKVNARGRITAVSLEYSTDGVAFSNSIPLSASLSGFQTTIEGATLSGLLPDTTYTYRFRATNTYGTTLSPVGTYSTLPAPIATVFPASEVATTSARFNGMVNARGYPASVEFEYGTDGNTFPSTITAVPATVSGTSSVPVSAAVAGLVKGTQYYCRVAATNEGGTGVSGVHTFLTLTEPVATVGEATALSTTRAHVEGMVDAKGSTASVFFDFGIGGVQLGSVPAEPATVSGSTVTPVSAVLQGLNQGTTYFYQVRADGGPAGTGFSPARTFTLAVLSGLSQTFPDPPPPAQGVVSVVLNPSNIGGGWRFVGEREWRPSGVAAGGLATGDRVIEFRPVPGWIQSPSETVGVVSGDPPTVLERDYYDAPAPGTGGMIVTLKPDSISAPTVPAATRAQWRLSGEGDTMWRDSGTVLSGLVPGSYLVECKPVAERTTPPTASVIVRDAETTVATLTYFLADAPVGTPPTVLPFTVVSTNEDMPFAFVGQLRSDAGSGTGFVVKRRVVATAAHMVFDDGTLSAATGLQWLFQRDRGTFEPKPQIPRGFYLFGGYAEQRRLENTPGTSSPQSQNLDVAALYFLEEAGRGGVGGFLASEALENEFLVSDAQKILVGYPVDGISAANQGRMHATSPDNLIFNLVILNPGPGRTYTTLNIRSSGGNSGGPLCVQHQNGKFYPAAIYLGGSAQTVVRAIDNAVVDLFNRAEVSGNGGDNNTGGGITHTSVSTIGSSTSDGALKVNIEPAAARNAGAGWRVSSESSYRPSGAQLSLVANTYTLRLTTVAGFQVPTQQTVRINERQLLTVTFTYAAVLTPLETWRQVNFGNPANSGIGADSADPEGDGFANLVEFAFGLNPNQNSAGLLPAWQKVGSNLVLSFSVPVGVSGITYVAEQSSNLAAGSWTAIPNTGTGAQRTFTVPFTSGPVRTFLRVRITMP